MHKCGLAYGNGHKHSPCKRYKLATAAHNNPTLLLRCSQPWQGTSTPPTKAGELNPTLLQRPTIRSKQGQGRLSSAATGAELKLHS
jgi:hypothetical protein